MSLSTTVMTHAERRDQAERLADLCSDLEPTVVEDPGVGSSLVTSAAAWAMADTGASHHLVLQDDALPAEGLAAHAASLAARVPEAAISLFTEWGCRTAGRVRVAALAGEATAPVVDPYVPSLALILPSRVAREFAEHARGLDSATPDDVALRAFLNERGVEQLVAVPNLVEHDTDATPTSLTGNAFQGVRRSVCFGPAPRATAPLRFGGVRRLAHIGWMRATAEVFDDVPDAPPAFLGAPVAEALARWVRPGALTERFEETVIHVTRVHGTGLTRVLAPTVLFELWMSWYAIGLGSGLQVDHLAREHLDPVAEAALGTVLPGVFRRYVPFEALATVREHAITFVLSAMRYGVAEPKEARERWLVG